MAQLNCHLCAILVHRIGQPFKTNDELIIPYAKMARSRLAQGIYCREFKNQQSPPALGPGYPVINCRLAHNSTLVGEIKSHWWNNKTVGQFHIAHFDWRKESRELHDARPPLIRNRLKRYRTP